MVISCWVNGCTNRQGGPIKHSFFSIPKIRTHQGEKTQQMCEERRRTWLANINRQAEPSDRSRICSEHFISGQPADLYDRTHPDWAPTLKLAASWTPSKFTEKLKRTESELKRYSRAKDREKTKEKHSAARAMLDLSVSETLFEPSSLDVGDGLESTPTESNFTATPVSLPDQ